MAKQISPKKSYRSSRSAGAPYPQTRDAQTLARNKFHRNTTTLPPEKILEKCGAAYSEVKTVPSSPLGERVVNPNPASALKTRLKELYEADDQNGFLEAILKAIKEHTHLTYREHAHFRWSEFEKSPAYTVPLIIFLELRPINDMSYTVNAFLNSPVEYLTSFIKYFKDNGQFSDCIYENRDILVELQSFFLLQKSLLVSAKESGNKGMLLIPNARDDDKPPLPGEFSRYTIGEHLPIPIKAIETTIKILDLMLNGDIDNADKLLKKHGSALVDLIQQLTPESITRKEAFEATKALLLATPQSFSMISLLDTLDDISSDMDTNHP